MVGGRMQHRYARLALMFLALGSLGSFLLGHEVALGQLPQSAPAVATADAAGAQLRLLTSQTLQAAGGLGAKLPPVLGHPSSLARPASSARTTPASRAASHLSQQGNASMPLPGNHAAAVTTLVTSAGAGAQTIITVPVPDTVTVTTGADDAASAIAIARGTPGASASAAGDAHGPRHDRGHGTALAQGSMHLSGGHLTLTIPRSASSEDAPSQSGNAAQAGEGGHN